MTKKRKEPHPTLFVFDGSIRYYKDGSMLELHTQVTAEEWEMIVSDTIKYKVFIDCLKEVACPILEDPWTAEDDYFRIQLEVSIARMRNIDPLLVAKFDQKEIFEDYKKLAQKNAQAAKAEINKIKQAQEQMLKDMAQADGDTTKVSDL